MLEPMLAAQKPPNLDKLVYPVYVQPKLDGIRARMDSVNLDTLWSRTGKLIPNEIIRRRFSYYMLGTDRSEHLLDGELVWPGHTYNETQSIVMSESHIHAELLHYYIFDIIQPFMRQDQRLNLLRNKVADTHFVKIVEHHIVNSKEELLLMDREYCEQLGAEGTIIRRPDGLYKHGRTTLKEALLLKYVEWVREEATVIGFNPQVCQGSYTRGTLGSLTLKSPHYDIPFYCGSGFTHDEGKEIWNNTPKYINRVLTFKYKPFGMKDVPRHPIFVGWRNVEIDS